MKQQWFTLEVVFFAAYRRFRPLKHSGEDEGFTACLWGISQVLLTMHHTLRQKISIMKTLATSVLLALTLITAAIAAPGRTTPRAHRSATSAHYQMGAYSSIDAKYVFVAIDKEAGGRVDIRLKDKTGTVFFEQTLAKKEAKVRLKLNVADLKDGNYVLEVSNGIETTVRDINIATNEPTQTVRNIVLL